MSTAKTTTSKTAKRKTPVKKLDTAAKSTKQEKVELNESEIALVKAERERNAKRALCAKEIQAILVKHNCNLVVNPQSAIGNPEIIVQAV